MASNDCDHISKIHRDFLLAVCPHTRRCMPRLSSRQARTRRLLRAYSTYHSLRLKRQIRRNNRIKRALQQAGFSTEEQARACLPASLQPQPRLVQAWTTTGDSDSSLDSSDSSIDSVTDTSDSDSTTSKDWSDLLGSDWRGSESGSSQSSEDSIFDSDSDSGDADDEMPELLPVGYPDSDDEDDHSADSTTSSETDSGLDEDVERRVWDGIPMEHDMPRRNVPLRWVRQGLEAMHAQRYEMPRNTFPRGPAFMRHVLNELKDTRPDLFREELRVSPATFDKLIDSISGDDIFTNNSRNTQMAVEDQLAITLFRFGHSGNAAGLQKVANWAGVGKGTVTLATRRVMTAILRKEFMAEAVRMPTESEKEKAKAWVEEHSCKAWRDGWCLVDGTLIPLFDRPFWFGESYFDRKCNYSLNIQIVSLPNLRIIDFGYGFTGSTHDSTAWDETRMVKEHDSLMKEGEWIWADSAYPIENWVVAPYKKPERDLPRNEEFNNHVSMVRIRSEHSIGYLKGRFQSLKGLRVLIKNEKTHKFATYWVAACIGVHSFAMQCEEEERGAGSDDEGVMADPFIEEGLSSSSSSSGNEAPAASHQRGRGTRLQSGKAKREALKRALFKAKEQHAERRARRQREELGLSSDSSEE
ncbi:DDE Tnp4 domain-containing protein [Mycena venus]|uniref:DDE Tnp4 domain-containing protein n=1 Tax=Mycena venus TaxID=2733690 RepID=A0A8H6YHP7_9AGAR|nr:DDE Tnp4 domain-containing protein [Mycena venus]